MDTEVAHKSMRRLSPANASRASQSRERRWRLPVAYRALPTIALSIDLAVILVSAIGAEFLYHNLPSEIEGEFAHDRGRDVRRHFIRCGDAYSKTLQP